MEEIQGKPRERRREKTRALILQTAEQLLAEGGLQKLTIAELANRAAYSKPAIYEYFEGLEDILIELTNAGFVRLGEQVQALPDSLPPDEHLVAIANTMLKFAADNAELYQLMFNHIVFTPERLNQHWAEIRGDTRLSYRVASRVIQAGIDQGIFQTRPGLDHDGMVYMSWAVIHGMASLNSSLVREVGLNIPHKQDLMLVFLIHNLKGISTESLAVLPEVKEKTV